MNIENMRWKIILYSLYIIYQSECDYNYVIIFRVFIIKNILK
jgi:hypothetical protein